MKALEISLLEQYANYSAVLFSDEGIIVNTKTSSPLVPLASTLQQLDWVARSAYLDNNTLVVKCYNTSTAEQILKQGFLIHPAKDFLYQSYQKPIQPLLLRAIHCLSWDTKLQYCSQCGTKIQKIVNKTEKKCAACHLSFFPNFSPAIMVLIRRDHEILLARSRHFETGMYSALAGFIDLGETAEEAVHREVQEEVGLKISDLKYFGTQPWPFPDSFMIAFTANYLSGVLNSDPEEIEDAQWFNIHHLPKLPSQASIARALIDGFILGAS
jgi:NAD+ diphosphatase